MNDQAPPVAWPALARGLAVAACALAFVELRASIDWYVAFHGWMRELGLGTAVRHLDAPLLLLAGTALGARLAAGRGRALAALGLRGSWRTGLAFGLAAAAPMLLQAFLGRSGIALSFTTVRAVIVMPFVEEALFRGLLVFVSVALAGLRFWPTAILSGLLFGSMHVSWGAPHALDDLPVFLATTAGGIWYAWIGRCFAWNLWPTIWLHAGMNAAWQVFGVADDAAGGLWPNVGRGLTIAAGTVLALRHSRRHSTAAPPAPVGATPGSDRR